LIKAFVSRRYLAEMDKLILKGVAANKKNNRKIDRSINAFGEISK
jgi:hypothetical protein